MIKKLRKRFSIAAIFSIFVTFTVLMVTINVINYHKIIENADFILTTLKENEGYFPAFGKDQNNGRWSKETPFESRYFIATISEDETITTIDMAKIQAIDITQARNYVKVVSSFDKTRGFYQDYRYIRYKENGNTVLIFLDCTRSLDNWRTFLEASCLVATIGLIISSILIVFISGRIMKPVAESYEKQKRFIIDAGHEIKTPLATIDADLTVLEMDGVSNEWTDDIHVQTKRLADLTNNLIVLSRMQETQKPEALVDLDLSKLVSTVANSFDARAKMENKTFEKDVDENVHMKGGQKEIEQLISILMDNAFKYSTENGMVRIALHQKKKIELIVYNTTEFIAKDSLPHLFDRFYRTDQSHNSQTGGYGIGLSIAQAIVQSYKGKIEATTEDEKSLRIQVEL
ncbi:sensor histidine kinase [Absicoccus intestinalis]|uniref:histidine kinase n=1 Tax=Absicoccus intestinalis TaxID=2926319 RepID=A0ABU4WNC0_9FIRM|nr:HAMP domain-containing sensor histidine kinase [Absicoccus sp. CLA-KB-P134]MDX8417759.1 HAMP domain-containing histidine kinase [Absicoccus sp. CLA-KB-P134]